MNNKLTQFAPRAGIVWQVNEKTALRGGWGRFYDTPHLFFNTRFANKPAVGRADHAHEPGRRLRQSVPGLYRRQSVPGRWPRDGRARRSRRPASTSTRRSTRSRRRCSSGTSARSASVDWLLTASYLGNHSSHLWRATELNYAVYTPGATTATTNARRVLVLQNPAQGAFYGTIGQLDDTGGRNYNGMLLSAQRRLKAGSARWPTTRCRSA
jgi:hypothetical protein